MTTTDLDGGRASRRAFLQAVTGALGVATARTASAQEATQYTVGMTDNLVFDPVEITISPGDTLVWVNRGTIGHSVTAYDDGIPDDADYFASGGFDAEGAARRAYQTGDTASGDITSGSRYQHTFDAEGAYDYFCIPHENLGMVGSVTVEEGGAPTEAEGFVSILPEQALTAAVASIGALFGVLGFAYVLLKYGGDYGESEE